MQKTYLIPSYVFHFLKNKGFKRNENFEGEIYFYNDFVEYTFFENEFEILTMMKENIEIKSTPIYQFPIPKDEKTFLSLIEILESEYECV